MTHCAPFSIASLDGVPRIWRNGQPGRPATPEEQCLMALVCEPRPDDSEAWRLVERLRDAVMKIEAIGNGHLPE